MLRLPEVGQRLKLSNCPDGQDAIMVGEFAKKHRILFIAKDEVAARSFEDVLRYFHADVPVFKLPAWDILPYDRLSPSRTILSQRIDVLAQLAKWQGPGIVIATVSGVLQRVPQPDVIAGLSFEFEVGKVLDRAGLMNFLHHNGYERVPVVREIGEYSIRGSIIDIYSPALDLPIRIDLFGDDIESIHTFTPEEQRSKDKLERSVLTPVSEVVLSNDSIKRFKNSYRELFGSIVRDDPLYESISSQRWSPGVENWLPLFYPSLTTLPDAIKPDLIVFDYQAVSAVEARFEQIDQHYNDRLEFLNINKKEPSAYKPLSPESLYYTPDEWSVLVETSASMECQPFNVESGDSYDAATKLGPQFYVEAVAQEKSAIDLAVNYIQAAKGRVIVAASSDGALSRLEGLLKDHGLSSSKYEAAVLSIERGLFNDAITIVTDNDILGDRLERKRQKSTKSENILKEVSQIAVGDYVVHAEHGIGRYQGVETLNVASVQHACLVIYFAGDDKLYVPVENIDVLSRYGSADQLVQLDRLGNVAWQARKAKAKERITAMAGELIKVAAARQLERLPAVEKPEAEYAEFCARFPYSETDDQLRAIEEVLSDLHNGIPMDRLVCGDVGFGKTEVAMRAAFCVAKSGQTVAVVVPTTLLARQHYQVFQERFKGFGLVIEQLSRFTSAKDVKRIKEQLNKGHVNIVIGTHSLLANDVKLKDLGLLVIDEEQHFGVAQKEKLKKLKEGVHVLTLTATPIPRTLQLSLTGVRDLSLISTPPVDRLAVWTSIMPYDPVTIKEAIWREHFRGGQTFYVCPRIKDISFVQEQLEKLVPEMKVAVAHGKKSTTELENIMTAFMNREYDVLLATNIIESGIDIPNANTIIIHRADNFGLAQLYQIRGRCGRSKTRGYAYLTYPADKVLTSNAQKRLEVMQTLDFLGAGFTLASYDMDIRGAGNLLGDEQSGHIKEVGVELYQQMLEEAVLEAKAKRQGLELPENDKWTPNINLGLPVLIPEDYIEDLTLRLSIYRRISDVKTDVEAESMAAELIDRFGGPLPQEIENLFKVILLKQACRKTGVEKIDVGPKGAVVSFYKNEFKNPVDLFHLIQASGGKMKLRPDHKMVVMDNWAAVDAKYKGVKGVLQQLDSLVK